MADEKILIGPEDRVFVLTGAGVSAESGLKTFRDQGGLWEGHRVEDVATPEGWAADAVQVWRFYSERRKGASQAQPNPAHIALEELEKQLGERFFLVTQNVDDLHERAGSKRVVHMHGELFMSRCENSGAGGMAGDAGGRDLGSRVSCSELCTLGRTARAEILHRAGRAHERCGLHAPAFGECRGSAAGSFRGSPLAVIPRARAEAFP